MKAKKQAKFQDLALDLIDEPSNALRVAMDDEKLVELERDIAANGLYYPLIVKTIGERYEVVDGHRRLIACRNIRLASVRCIVHGKGSPPPEATKLKANLLREDNTDAELAVWLGELAQKHGYTLSQLSDVVGRSESWVNDRTDLLRGDVEVLQALGDRKINFSVAKVLNRCKNEKWRKLALYHAIMDQLPAARLNDWLIRNATEMDNPRMNVEPVAIVPVDGVQTEPGIRCDFCGGWKDPQNMVNVWLHRWEWTIVQQALAIQHQAAEPAAVEPADPAAAGVDGAKG
jgi:ParB family transcriptional regulator, chromosome partitioning protein